MKKVTYLVMFVALFFVLSSCKTGPEQNTGNAVKNELEGAPKWVLQNANKNNNVCGVGSAAGTRNVSVARTSAMGRARTEIARSLQVKVKSMLKDYQSTTTGGEAFGKAANDEQHIEDVSKQITDMTLSGTELQDTWISNTGTLYTLVCLDVEKFKNSLSQMSQLNEQVRQAVVERANKAFNELDAATSPSQ